MDMKEYCSSIGASLSDWRANMYDLLEHVETLPAYDRHFFAPDVSRIRSIIAGIEDTLQELKTLCPVNYSVTV